MQQDVFVLRPFCFCCYFHSVLLLCCRLLPDLDHSISTARVCVREREKFSFREKIRENVFFVLHEERAKAQIRCRGHTGNGSFASSCLYQIAWENRDSKLPGSDWSRLRYYDTLETWHCSRSDLDAQTQPSAAFPKHNQNISLHTHRTLWMKSTSFKDISITCSL